MIGMRNKTGIRNSLTPSFRTEDMIIDRNRALAQNDLK
jgi:hypothetical protein